MPSNYQKTLVVPKNEFGTPHVSVPIYYFGNSLRSKHSSATKCTPVEGLEPPATRLKAERSDPLSYTSEGGAYCCRIPWLLRIYARVETARTKSGLSRSSRTIASKDFRGGALNKKPSCTSLLRGWLRGWFTRHPQQFNVDAENHCKMGCMQSPRPTLTVDII